MIGGSGISKNTVPFGSTFTVILSKEGWWESWGIMPYSSAGRGFVLDGLPQRLKPVSMSA